MMLIDTHCHLDLLENPEAKYNSAVDSGVHAIIIPSINASSLPTLNFLTSQLSNTYFAAGIYPTEIENINKQITEIGQYLLQKSNKLIAIGECGLDFSFSDVNDEKILILKKQQIQLFTQHIKWALTYQLPLIIHNRKANEELLNIIIDSPQVRGVFHCFSGRKSFARQIIEQTNFYFGLGGLIAKDMGLAETVKMIPLERIVLETDSPYLIPKGVKSNSITNEPAFIVYTAHKLAQLKGVSFDVVSATTTQNAKKLFNI